MDAQNYSAPVSEVSAPMDIPVVGLVAPSGRGAGESWKTLVHTEEVLGRFGLGAERWETDVSPTRRGDHGRRLAEGMARGWCAVIVGSPDGALPRALAGAGPLPVFRVPLAADAGSAAADALKLLWPEGDDEPGAGAAFATVAIGEAGAKNAALLVVAMLALEDIRLRGALETFRQEQTAAVLASTLPAEE